MNKEYLICIDSDGCAMDTMNVKHIQCFGPCMVREWGMEKWQEEILERWNEINLYSMTRGINRFKALAMALTEIDERLVRIEDVSELSGWTLNAPELSNEALETEIRKTQSPVFKKALAWSEAVNEAIAALPNEKKLPFEGVTEGLNAAHEFADVAIVSSANEEAVREEWQRCGLMEYVDILLCQNAGSKASCIAELRKKGYDEKHILMVGDAPGDKAAAEKNHVFYYPILARREAESWKELVETGFEKLKNGTYEPYGLEKAKQFIRNLEKADGNRFHYT